MREARRIYCLALVAMLVLFALFDNWFFAWIFVATVLFEVLFYILLRRDVGIADVSLKWKHSFQMETDEPIQLEIQKTGMPLVAGIVEVRLRWTNRMIMETAERTVRFLPHKKQMDWILPLELNRCGEITVERAEVYMYDVFGVSKRKMATFLDHHMVAYPQDISLEIEIPPSWSGAVEEEKESISRRGTDMAEVYDLREYQPGDSLRAVHWKLSSKTDEYIVKEPGDTMHTDILVLFDVSKDKLMDNEQGAKLLNVSVAFARKLSSVFVNKQMDFMAAYPSGGALHWKLIGSQQDNAELIENWLSVPLPEEPGSAIRYFSVSDRKNQFFNIIYITTESISKELFEVTEKSLIHAISIVSEGTEAKASSRNNCRMTELPVDILLEQDNYLVI